ncbi:DUF1203 domain-containing protein [uncultured Hoeflea sp.]|uniref:DUF1203 domain-containing protein n=1 Tax=uncultured Hoeflea sp. TaxID=538666 RepID=UPI00261C71B5|nr:DUF1203 domain-containing protein [uncultured Hoeflea sp.]
MPFTFEPMDPETAAHFRAGGPDAYGNAPERAVSEGTGVPCRRCMGFVAANDPYLIVAWRPFSRLHPYAETGPVFLHAEHCAPPQLEPGQLPPFLNSPDYIVRGYSADERIVYGTGEVTGLEAISTSVDALLTDPAVDAVHIRSARNNCYHCRAVRTP